MLSYLFLANSGWLHPLSDLLAVNQEGGCVTRALLLVPKTTLDHPLKAKSVMGGCNHAPTHLRVGLLQ